MDILWFTLVLLIFCFNIICYNGISFIGISYTDISSVCIYSAIILPIGITSIGISSTDVCYSYVGSNAFSSNDTFQVDKYKGLTTKYHTTMKMLKGAKY
jgi:hypothetical protein